MLIARNYNLIVYWTQFKHAVRKMRAPDQIERVAELTIGTEQTIIPAKCYSRPNRTAFSQS